MCADTMGKGNVLYSLVSNALMLSAHVREEGDAIV
jgi:hypothetical protein